MISLDSFESGARRHISSGAFTGCANQQSTGSFQIHPPSGFQFHPHSAFRLPDTGIPPDSFRSIHIPKCFRIPKFIRIPEFIRIWIRTGIPSDVSGIRLIQILDLFAFRLLLDSRFIRNPDSSAFRAWVRVQCVTSKLISVLNRIASARLDAADAADAQRVSTIQRTWK